MRGQNSRDKKGPGAITETGTPAGVRRGCFAMAKLFLR